MPGMLEKPRHAEPYARRVRIGVADTHPDPALAADPTTTWVVGPNPILTPGGFQ